MRILRRTELPAELLQIEIESVLSSPSSNTARNAADAHRRRRAPWPLTTSARETPRSAG
ncbi:MAG: hypothetical protein R2748_12380 [Bryobacterales bacterium]